MAHEVEGLMGLPENVRKGFLSKVMQGVKPAYKITVPGDPKRMQEMRATLPNISTAHKVAELREDLYDGIPKVTRIMSRTMARAMRRELLDIEMSLSGGG